MAQGVEALIGVVNDEGFGPAVTFGLGGIFSEALKDVTFRIAPFDIETARDMIGELRGAKLFDGYRGARRPTRKRSRARWSTCRAWRWRLRRASRKWTSTRCSSAPTALSPPTRSSC